MVYSTSKTCGIITHSYTVEGKKIYTAKIETIIRFHSEKGNSLPIIDTTYNGKPSIAYGLSYTKAVKHIKSLGFNGEIKTI